MYDVLLQRNSMYVSNDIGLEVGCRERIWQVGADAVALWAVQASDVCF